MPDFASARSTLSMDKKMSHDELVRALRFSIAAEYEAIQIYQEIVDAIDDKETIDVINDIIDEEKVHAGQFMGALFRLSPEEPKKYEQGQQENQKIKAGKKG